MAGYSKARKMKAPDRFTAVVDVWERLWQRYEANDQSSSSSSSSLSSFRLQPNLHALTILIRACQAEKTADAAHLAQDALERFYRLPVPNDGPDVKEELHGEMDETIPTTGINTQVVTSVLDCWQKSGDREAGPKAQALLEWLVQEYQTTRNPHLQPNAYTFSATIGAWARSRKFGKAAHASQLLTWMQELYNDGVVAEPPNVYCYTGVINSCAYSEKDVAETKRALDICVATYQQMPAAPTHITYAAVLTALRNLVPPSAKRTAVVRNVFGDAARRGQVCDLVLQRLQSVVTAQEVHAVLASAAADSGDADNDDSSHSVSLQNIPDYWKRNVGQDLCP